MEIVEYIYEGVVEPAYLKKIREYANRDGRSRKIRGEAALSNDCSETSETTSKHRKRYVYHPKDISKLTCLIHGPGHSPD